MPLLLLQGGLLLPGAVPAVTLLLGVAPAVALPLPLVLLPGAEPAVTLLLLLLLGAAPGVVLPLQLLALATAGLPLLGAADEQPLAGMRARRKAPACRGWACGAWPELARA